MPLVSSSITRWLVARHPLALEIGNGLDGGILAHEEFREERGEDCNHAQVRLRLAGVDHLAGDGVVRLQLVGETEFDFAGVDAGHIGAGAAKGL
jgi:hypothetical protein